MLKIGENIHILSRRQKAAGADVLDLNIGPQKKAGPEVMDWLVECVQEAVPGMTLSFDTTNLAAIEVGLKKGGAEAHINLTAAGGEAFFRPDHRGGDRSRAEESGGDPHHHPALGRGRTPGHRPASGGEVR